jgi:hypothetical protein
VVRADTWNGEAPQPEAVRGTQWDGLAQLPPANRLDLELENVVRAQLDGSRAGLSGRRCLQVTIAADAPARVTLDLPLPRGSRARRGTSCSQPGAHAGEVSVGRGGATFRAPAGTGGWVILPG